MTLEYLLINFREDRTVLANDTAVGVANHIILLPTGDYVISLDGDTTTPTDQTIGLNGTSPVRPKVILFS